MFCEKIMDAAGDAPNACEEGEKVLKGDPDTEEENEDPKGCWEASPLNIAPGEKGMVEEESFDDDNIWLDSNELGGGEEA